MSCIFCKIAAGEIPSQKVYEDEAVYAFRDINPVAPVHILIVPKTHIPSVGAINSENSSIVARIFEVIPKIAEAEGLSRGYRVVSNAGEDAGQTVMHLHFHIIGGRKLTIMA
ncbi:MAG: histidine triad nucleotide-binding protein [Clostridiales bacterium]|jgi:histidine triad (HIT) family protein|nr:histidine triad nucleotide-binding protein [Clostridiales bacterium]